MEVILFAKTTHKFLVLLKAEGTFPVDSVAFLNVCFNVFDLSASVWKVVNLFCINFADLGRGAVEIRARNTFVCSFHLLQCCF